MVALIPAGAAKGRAVLLPVWMVWNCGKPLLAETSQLPVWVPGKPLLAETPQLPVWVSGKPLLAETPQPHVLACSSQEPSPAEVHTNLPNGQQSQGQAH